VRVDLFLRMLFVIALISIALPGILSSQEVLVTGFTKSSGETPEYFPVEWHYPDQTDVGEDTSDGDIISEVPYGEDSITVTALADWNPYPTEDSAEPSNGAAEEVLTRTTRSYSDYDNLVGWCKILNRRDLQGVFPPCRRVFNRPGQEKDGDGGREQLRTLCSLLKARGDLGVIPACKDKVHRKYENLVRWCKILNRRDLQGVFPPCRRVFNRPGKEKDGDGGREQLRTLCNLLKARKDFGVIPECKEIFNRRHGKHHEYETHGEYHETYEEHHDDYKPYEKHHEDYETHGKHHDNHETHENYDY